jgi:hypothetical protein
MPVDTVLLVDEFHEIFFNQSATVVNGKLVSTILKLRSSVKLIGVSATFRGDAGIDKINTIMSANFLKTSDAIKDRGLQSEVFGETMNIKTAAVKLAIEKSKTMPVIIFCSNPREYK